MPCIHVDDFILINVIAKSLYSTEFAKFMSFKKFYVYGTKNNLFHIAQPNNYVTESWKTGPNRICILKV